MNMPTFKHPDIVKIATALFVAVVILLIHHEDHLDKAAFDLAVGFAMLYLTSAGWALSKGAGNTAVYVVTLGALMFVGAFTLTASESLKSLAVDAVVPQVIGVVGALFTIALRNGMDKEDGNA